MKIRLWTIGLLAMVALGPAEAADESRFLSNARQLTYDGRRSGEGYFSADGTKLIFQSEREPGNPFYQIYLLDLETGDTQRISPGVGKTTCAWLHPGGRLALFASTHDDPQAKEKQESELADRASAKERRYAWDYDEHFELYAKELTTGELTRLTEVVGYDAEGCYSPDGARIVFASNRHAYAQPLSESDAKAFEHDKSYLMDIYIMDADGSDVRRLTDTPGYDGGPFFSANGKKICWRRFSPEGTTAEIYTMNADGSDPRQITRMGAMSWAPFFHPSGDYLIFTTNKHGFDNFELYMVDAAGSGEPVRVTATPGFDGLPVFSPDGKRLAWTSTRTPDKRSQIFIAEWDHHEASKRLRWRALGDPKVAITVSPVLVRSEPAIAAKDLRTHVEYLASEPLGGRLTGTEGELLATKYVADALEHFGLDPVNVEHGYFQPFEFTAGVSLGDGNRLSMDGPGAKVAPATVDQDWRPLAFSRTGRIEPTEIVFAGYGIVAPEGDKQPEYDSYVHLDVKDKWVMTLRYMPESVPPERRQHLSRYASLRHKAMIARDKGAAGIIVVSGPNSKVREQLVPLSLDGALAGTSIGAISVTDSWASRYLGKDLKALQDKLDTGEMVMGFEIPEVKLSATIDMRLEKRTGRNVLARLNAGARAAKTAVLIGAHIDHLGRGRHSGSLAGAEHDSDAVHHGADDNASGVAVVLEVAQYLAELKRQGKLDLQHDIIFAAWSGEELGLLGSSHYVGQMRDGQTPEVVACLNLDMVGRYRDKLTLQGVGSSPAWPGLIERANVPLGLSLTLVSDSYLPTDSTSFYVAGVPSLAFFTGAHEDYHKPSDTADKLNYEAMEKIARFVSLIARGLATSEQPPAYIAQAKPQAGERRGGLRAYLGSVPDYAQDESVKGVKLSGVAKGGPAETAGLRAGDVIVELAGRKIENIYDYTYAIEALKIGQETKIAVMRGGERKQFKITPGSRE